jgi:hypothetical protein
MPMESASEACEYTNPGHPPPSGENTSPEPAVASRRAGNELVGRMVGIILRDTLHHAARDTYFDQWTEKFALRIKGTGPFYDLH